MSSLNEYWLGSVAAGTNYTFTADVVYTIDGLNFDVTFTLSDGTTTQDLTQTFLAADYTGDFYGFGSRAITGNIFDYDTFDIAPVPEPTTVAMLLGGLGLLALRRRR